MSWYTKWKEEVKSKKSSKKSASSFWYDTYDTSYDYLDIYGGWGKEKIESYKKTNNLYKLASVRRAIANFVQIVTQQNIPVTFATKSDSKTDGKKVILSADVDDKFDVSVGLALHEGSHIVLSDFNLLKYMSDMYERYTSHLRSITYSNKAAMENGNALPYPDKKSYDDAMKAMIRKYPAQYHSVMEDIYLSTGRIGKYGDISEELYNVISGLTNWVEDRRIDSYIYKSAPGYRDYYTQMYDHYFNDKLVTKGIASDEFTDETFDSYMFRIVNLLNENTDLSKLKALRSIYRMLDLKNIGRIDSSLKAMVVAIDIVEEILKNIPLQYANKQAGGKGEGDSGSGQPSNGDSDVNEIGDGENDQMGGTSADVNGMEGDTSNEETDSKTKMSKTALEQLMKKIQKQKDFINGNLKKKTITTAEAAKLSSIEESGTDIVRVGSDYQNSRGEKIGKGVDCVVVKKLTESLLTDTDFPFRSSSSMSDVGFLDNEMKKGLVLGTILGKKLQIRGESRETIFSRLKKGKIDRRMVASLGYDNDSVFFTNEIDQYKKANLHISVDYSGSMSGEKLRKAVVVTTAIVKACSMARNVNVQVSVRSTETSGRALPYIAVIYDSRKDSLKTFCKYISRLNVANTTPEGLCFEAIMKQLIPSDSTIDSYFLNISDGEPYYSISTATDNIGYSGENAAKHTFAQVKKMKGNGINVLSYFMTEYNSSNFEHSTSFDTFKQSYGADAKYVDAENVTQIARTMNELFLKKA